MFFSFPPEGWVKSLKALMQKNEYKYACLMESTGIGSLTQILVLNLNTKFLLIEITTFPLT